MEGSIAGTISTAHLYPSADDAAVAALCKKMGDGIGGYSYAVDSVGGIDPDDFATQLMPSGLSIRGRYWFQKGSLYAVVNVQGAGKPFVVRTRVKLKPIEEKLRAWHDAEHARVKGDDIRQPVGEFEEAQFLRSLAPHTKISEALDFVWTDEGDADEIGAWYDAVNPVKHVKAVASAASTVYRGAKKGASVVVSAGRKVYGAAKDIASNQIARAIKGVIQSKYTAAAVMAFAYAYPPAGVPLAAAYAKANAMLAAADQYQAAVDKGLKLGKDALAKGKSAVNLLRGAQDAARRGDKGAQKLVREIQVVKRSRDKIKQMAIDAQRNTETFDGILVLKNGKLLQGAWHKKLPTVSRGRKAGRLISTATRNLAASMYREREALKKKKVIPTLTRAQEARWTLLKMQRMGRVLVPGSRTKTMIPQLRYGGPDRALQRRIQAQAKVDQIKFNMEVYGVPGGESELMVKHTKFLSAKRKKAALESQLKGRALAKAALTKEKGLATFASGIQALAAKWRAEGRPARRPPGTVTTSWSGLAAAARAAGGAGTRSVKKAPPRTVKKLSSRWGGFAAAARAAGGAGTRSVKKAPPRTVKKLPSRWARAAAAGRAVGAPTTRAVKKPPPRTTSAVAYAKKLAAESAARRAGRPPTLGRRSRGGIKPVTRRSSAGFGR